MVTAASPATAQTITIPSFVSETINQSQIAHAAPGVGYPGLVTAWGFQLPADLPTVYSTELEMPLSTTIVSPQDNGGPVTVGFYGVDVSVQITPLADRFSDLYVGNEYEIAPGNLTLLFATASVPLNGAPTTVLDIPLDAQAIFQIQGAANGGGFVPQTGVFIELPARTGAFSTLFTNPQAPPQLVLTVPEPSGITHGCLRVGNRGRILFERDDGKFCQRNVVESID